MLCSALFQAVFPRRRSPLLTRWSRRSACTRPEGGMTHEATCNAAFRRHHRGRLLHRIATLLPQWLNGPELARGCRDLVQLCWRELGYQRQPVFDGDLPPFLMVDADGYSANLSMPTAPAKLAARMAALELSPLPQYSLVGTNLSALARLLNLTSFEFQWLL